MFTMFLVKSQYNDIQLHEFYFSLNKSYWLQKYINGISVTN